MKNIRRLLIVLLAVCLAVTFTSCAKQRSSYVSKAVYVYDDSQEVNAYVEETESIETELSEEGMSDISEEQDIQEETEAETAENEENATQPAIENEQETEETTEAAPTVIDNNNSYEQETQAETQPETEPVTEPETETEPPTEEETEAETEPPTEPQTQEVTEEQRNPEEDPVESLPSEEETGETNPEETGEIETDEEGTEGETETTNSDTPGDTPADYPEESAEDVTEQDTEQQSETEMETETETEPESESPTVEEQETDTGSDDDGSGEENPTEDSTEEKGQEVPTKEETSTEPPTETETETEPETETTSLSSEKIIGLECRGNLGTYIWGETPDLSGIEVSVLYEDGHKEPTLNYTINMNYPTLSYHGPTPNDVFSNYAYCFDESEFRTYEPGTYNATISVEDFSMNVEYSLIIVYGVVISKHWLECKDPVGHNVVYRADGSWTCDKWQECLDAYTKADGTKAWTSGSIFFYPMILYYDYVLTEEEVKNDPYFWSKWPGIENAVFLNFPAYYDKNTGSCISEGAYRNYGNGSSFYLYDYARIKALQG